MPLHPCETVAPQKTAQRSLDAAHPNPAKVAYLLGELGLKDKLTLTSSPPYAGMTMCAYIRTPQGVKTLMS